MAYIEFQHVKKFYGKKNEAVIKALDDTNFTVEEGELAVILGASGAGKTTALNILGGMDQATQGEVIVAGKHLNKFSEKELVKYRRNDVGFVLNPEDVLKKVGLEDRMKNFPAQLSGGEQQRVAIARAIAKNPKLLLCDEPTGALDYNTGKQILQLLQDTCRKEHMTVIIITHNSALAPMADRIIRFKSGKVTDITLNENPTPISEIEW